MRLVMKLTKAFLTTLIMLTWFVAHAESGQNQPQQDIPAFKRAEGRALVNQLVQNTRGKVGISKNAKTGAGKRIQRACY